MSAFLFYYIIVFLPRERKRQKSYNFIGYKILDISMYIEDIFFKIYNVNDFPTKISTLNITRDTLKAKCQLVNPSLPVRSRFNNIVKFQNFDKFLDYSAQKIEPLTRDIIMLDLLDDSCFENIILINKTITFSWFLEISSDFPLNKTLEGYTDTLYTLFEQNESLKANFLLYGRFYEFEFHHNARKNEFKRRARDKQLNNEGMRAQSGS